MAENWNCNMETSDDRDILLKLHGKGLIQVVELIFSFLDLKSIIAAETVSKSWREIIADSRIWEAFVKSKTATVPLWKRLYNLLKSDENLCPAEQSISSFKQITEALSVSCRRLEENWLNPCVVHRQMICDSVDWNAAIHCQIDDNYLAVKNTEGVLKVWSKKTGLLLNELNSSPEPQDTFGTYAVGNKLALCSGLDGVIHVWDLNTSKMIFEILDLKGFKIMNLNFLNPDDGLLMASSNNLRTKTNILEPGSLITLWKERTNKSGNFLLKFQHSLPDEVLQILGWGVRTFGLLCKNPSDKALNLVQIYTNGQTFKLVSTILLEKNYRLDWADGNLVIASKDLIKFYDIVKGECFRTIQVDPTINSNFSQHGSRVGVCSTKLVCSNHGADRHRNWYDEGNGLHLINLSEEFFDPKQKHTSFSFSSDIMMELNEVVDKLKINEFQLVTVTVEKSDRYDSKPGVSCIFHIMDLYPACAKCGLYKRGMAKDKDGHVLHCDTCICAQYCSTYCRETYRENHPQTLCTRFFYEFRG